MSERSYLTITAPTGAICGLHPNVPASTNDFRTIDPKNAIPATKATTLGAVTAYDHADLEPGLYHCCASMEGYSALCQTLLCTPEKAGMQLHMQLEPLAGDGYEAGYVMCCPGMLCAKVLPPTRI